MEQEADEIDLITPEMMNKLNNLENSSVNKIKYDVILLRRKRQSVLCNGSEDSLLSIMLNR